MRNITLADLYDARVRDFSSDLVSLKELLNFGSCLEVGCGTGRMIQACLDKVSTYVGIEVNEDAADLSRKKYKSKSCVEIINENFLNWQSNQLFDNIIFGFNVLSEFASVEDRLLAIDKARSLLDANGKIILMNDMHDFEDFARLFSSAKKKLEINNQEWAAHFECKRNPVHQTSECTVSYYNILTQETIVDRYTRGLLTRNEIIGLGLANQLCLYQEFGGYGLEPLTISSDIMIHIFKKP